MSYKAFPVSLGQRVWSGEGQDEDKPEKKGITEG